MTAGPPHPSRAAVVGVFLLLCTLWGTTWAAIRIGLAGIPPFTGVALRFGIASVLLLALSPAFGVRLRARPRDVGLWITVALLSFCGSYGIVYWSEQWVPSGLAAVLFATFPFFTSVLAHFTLPDERLALRSSVGIVVGFTGVAVIFSEDFSRLGGRDVAVAAAVMLGSPLVSAFSQVAVKRWSAGMHPIVLTAMPMGICSMVMGSLAAITEGDRRLVLDLRSVGALLYLAVFGSAVTFTLYYWLLSHLPATRVALIAYVTPVVAVLVGTLALDEPYTGRMLAGSALVVCGVGLAVTRAGRSRRS